jgi:hypothetical protein
LCLRGLAPMEGVATVSLVRTKQIMRNSGKQTKQTS